MGGPCTMTAIPRLFLAARPSGVRSIPRWRAIAAETGVISKSPTAMSLPAEWQKKLRHHRAYLTTKESWPKVATWTPTKSLKHDITDKKTLIWNPLNFTQWSTTCQQVWRVKGMLVPWAPLCDLQVLQPLLCARTTINCKAAWTQRPDVLSRACCARTTTHYDKTVVLWHRGATSSSFRGGAIFTNFHSMTSSCLFNRRKRSQIEFSSQYFWKLQLFCLKGHSMSNELKKWRSQPTISDFPQIS